MKPIEFSDGEVQVDASIVAEGLGIALPVLRQQMRRARSRACPSAASMRMLASIA